MRADGFRMDGRRWKVDWASYEDFKMFGWKWFEGRAPSPRRCVRLFVVVFCGLLVRARKRGRQTLHAVLTSDGRYHTHQRPSMYSHVCYMCVPQFAARPSP